MQIPLEANFLVPNAAFLIELLAVLTGFVLLVLWPGVDTIVRRQWGYTLAIVLLGPIGGLLWWTFGRRDTRLAPQRDRQPTSN